jgi:hypothetical protein
MKRALAVLLSLLAFPLSALASGGGSPPPPWNPPNKLTVLFAYSSEMESRGLVCFTRPKNYYKRFCVDANRHASEMADYVNYLFEVSSVNVQAVPKATPFGHAFDPGREDDFIHVVRTLRQQHQANVLMIVRADPWNGASGGCNRNDESCWASWRRSGFRPLKQTVAHEIGHWHGIHHSADEGFEGMPRHAVGWGTWAFVDVMHPQGTRGNGTIVRDTYSDHERWCNSWQRCGDYHTGSAARYLRDKYGRWKR